MLFHFILLDPNDVGSLRYTSLTSTMSFPLLLSIDDLLILTSFKDTPITEDYLPYSILLVPKTAHPSPKWRLISSPDTTTFPFLIMRACYNIPVFCRSIIQFNGSKLNHNSNIWTYIHSPIGTFEPLWRIYRITSSNTWKIIITQTDLIQPLLNKVHQ